MHLCELLPSSLWIVVPASAVCNQGAGAGRITLALDLDRVAAQKKASGEGGPRKAAEVSGLQAQAFIQTPP